MAMRGLLLMLAFLAAATFFGLSCLVPTVEAAPKAQVNHSGHRGKVAKRAPKARG